MIADLLTDCKMGERFTEATARQIISRAPQEAADQKVQERFVRVCFGIFWPVLPSSL